tara:strand:- start:287 stop:1165 length:879 start_codon:yes stop_codon:yes gene_type:complete
MFEYSEPLSGRYLNALPQALRVDDNSFAETYLIRLLTGTVDIYHITSGNNYRIRSNYSILSYCENNRISSRIIRDCFDSVTNDQVADYLVKNHRSNKNFNETLLLEATHFLYSKNNRNYLSAFVHLYRLIEFISYSFPLIHTSNTKNYFGSFESLKQYFSGDGSELKFLIRFVNNLFDSRPELNLEAEFSVPGTNSELRRKLYRSIKHILRSKSYIVYDDTLYQFKVEYKNLIDLVVFIRNRYFHFATGSGMKNFKSSELIDPDIFFELIIDNSFNWISRIYFEILLQNISE